MTRCSVAGARVFGSKSSIINYLQLRYLNVTFFWYFSLFSLCSLRPLWLVKKSLYGILTNREGAKDTKEEKRRGKEELMQSVQFNQVGVCCNSGRSSATIAPSTGHTCKQIPQSMQVSKSIQNQSVPLTFFPGPGWMQATGQAPTQSATPSQIFVFLFVELDLVQIRI